LISINANPARIGHFHPITTMEMVMIGSPQSNRLWRRAAFGVVIAAALAAGGPARAQWFPETAFGLGSGPLTHEDVELVLRSSAPLFEAAPAGAVARWENPSSGNKGSITLLRLYALKGLSCRTMRYTAKYPNHSYSNARVVDWCEVSPGEWKLVDPIEMRGG
jgi:hypothetical protein